MSNIFGLHTFKYHEIADEYVPSDKTVWVNMDNVLYIEEACMGDKNTKGYWLNMIDGKSLCVTDLECIGIGVKWN